MIPKIDSLQFLWPRDDKPARKKKTGRPKGRRDKKPRRKVRWKTKVKVIKIRDPKAPKKPTGRPAHEPTAQTRHTVRKLITTGYFRQEHIADCIGVGLRTLRKYYRDELVKAKGDFATNIMMVSELKAVGGPPDPVTGHPNWREADTQLLKFFLERVCGIVPPTQKLQHSGTLGVFDPSKLTDEEQRLLEPILAKLAGEPGSGEGSATPASSGYGEEGDAEGDGEP